MSLVLDPSVALAWVFSDEQSSRAAEVQDMVAQSGAWVPQLWRLEVANGLQIGVRRGRLSVAARDAWLTDFAALPIQSDPETETLAWTAILVFAERFTLTLYDAAYLELAHRRGLPLASLDRELRAAATELKIDLLGL